MSKLPDGIEGRTVPISAHVEIDTATKAYPVPVRVVIEFPAMNEAEQKFWTDNADGLAAAFLINFDRTLESAINTENPELTGVY